MKTIVVFGKTIKAANDKLREIRDEMRFGDIEWAGANGFQYKIRMKNGDVYLAAEAGRHSVANWDYAYIDESIPDRLIVDCLRSRGLHLLPDNPSGIGFEYFNSDKKSSWGTPESVKAGGYYYYLNDLGEPVFAETEENSLWHRTISNCFTNKDAAEKWSLKETLRRRMQRFSDENGGTDISWARKDQPKYYIVYNYNFNEFLVLRCGDNQLDSVYFASEDVAHQALKIFEPDLREAWGI